MLFAYKNVWGIGPERDDMRARGMTAQLMNHARTIAKEQIPSEVQPKDLIYLKVEAPPPETPEQTAARLMAQSGHTPVRKR